MTTPLLDVRDLKVFFHTSEGVVRAVDDVGNQGTVASVAGDTTAAPSTIVVFADDMESGPGAWVADSPWGQTTSESHSPNTSWTDSPGVNYANGINVSLTSPTIATSYPTVISFWHRRELRRNDVAYVEVEADGDGNWVTAQEYRLDSTSWTQETIPSQMR